MTFTRIFAQGQQKRMQTQMELGKSAENYRRIMEELQTHASKYDKPAPQLITVTKTFGAEAILPVINAGARVFGENRVQEAQGKWPDLKKDYPDIELHLIGPLQSNKAADAVALFESIQTIDREKIARAISQEIKKQEKTPELFVQVNTGSEPQKSGVMPEAAVEFVRWCKDEVGLTISGLMCIPPFGENPGPHFALLSKIGREAGTEKLSMGMSADYLTATEFGATHVRVGSSIFGGR